MNFFLKKKDIYIKIFSKKDEATKTKKNKRNKKKNFKRKKNLSSFFRRSLLVKLHNPQLHATKDQKK